MTQEEAVGLIKKAIPQSTEAQRWADLGCGNGIFTAALANLLPKGSHIYAVDQSYQQLRKISNKNVSIEFLQADFERAKFDFTNLTGILMANSLHFIEDKQTLIQNLDKHLSKEKQFLIIEYDTTAANQWVPFPINFNRLKELFTKLGYDQINKIAECSSVFGQGNLYAAIINKNK